ALAGRGWDADGELSLAISEDALAPWNAGTWRVTVSGGSAEVAPGGGNPDLSLSIKALALLYTGRRSARELAAWGMVDGVTSALRRADALFATPHAPHCPDHF
ncbi:MAG: GNAT family N-acetyltransferase, partial [Gammaproteobacteria bacterium]|nr:GNAT family N-acetyltransferase [Gammaproteobacteria bacterium]